MTLAAIFVGASNQITKKPLQNRDIPFKSLNWLHMSRSFSLKLYRCV